MTRMTNARVAGFAQLAYIVAGISNEVLMGRVNSAEGAAARIARFGQHATEVRISILLTLVECISAFVMAVALYAITSDQNRELSMLALICRVVEGMFLCFGITGDLQLLWLAGAQTGLAPPDLAATNGLGAFLLLPSGSIGAIFFAIGNTIFSYLLLRGRLIPVAIAGWGVVASALLVVGLPLHTAGFFTGFLADLQWLPEILFAFGLALWLLIRGVSAPATR